MPIARMSHQRVTRMLFLTRGEQIEKWYNPHRPSIRAIVQQVETHGYRVLVRLFRGQPWQDIIDRNFTYQRLGSQLLIIYPHQFDPQRNEDKIAVKWNWQIHCNLVWVEVTENHFKDGSRPILEFDDPALDFHGLTAMQYQGDIIQWLQREYRDHVQVHYTLYKDYRQSKRPLSVQIVHCRFAIIY